MFSLNLNNIFVKIYIMKQFKMLAIICAGIMVMSCDSDDDTNTPTKEIDVPETYAFQRDGNSTVNFNGQNTRILMANEILAKFIDFEHSTEDQLLSMYNHQAGANDFSHESLNATSKNIRSKVAASAEYFATNAVLSEQIKQNFESLISNQANQVIPNYNSPASAGVAGQVVVGTKTRYINEKGFENNQLFAKGLIGALITDQALNNYLSTSVLDAADNRTNNDKGVLAEGKNYTTMEHKWDEAYGYIYGGEIENEANPNAAKQVHNHFLHNYILKVDGNEHFKGIAEDIFNAFKKGRAAIVAKDYKVRDEQIKILKEKISTVIAVRAIHYLQSGKENIEQGTRPASFHALSEGLGFFYSLQFSQNPATGQPYVSSDDVTTQLEKVSENDGLWTVDASTLKEISDLIASRFPFTVADAK